MSVAHAPGSSVLDEYRSELESARGGGAGTPGVDELVVDGLPRAASAALAESIEKLGDTGLRLAHAEARRYVRDDGITYGSTEEGLQARRWHLDPLPVVIDAPQWATLEAGLQQRSRLMDAIFTDLYGQRRLLKSRTLPAEVVLGHPGFIRQADGIRIAGPHQLILTSSDLARGEDGSWRVLSDRNQAPSGAGYAMANRRITSRVLAGLHRSTNLARLRSFFHTMTDSLQASAAGDVEQPRTVLLSPGAAAETAFDQSFTAMLLGIPLVEADDLISKDGRIWLRATNRLDPVDVIYRRVDSEWIDPLELRAESQLGLPGMIDAARRNQVAVTNPIGSGVLESPGLLPFLPAAARELLGEDLLLESAPTWWCGDEIQRQHVLSNLSRLVIKPLSREEGEQSVVGWELDESGREALARRIAAEPLNWCGQDPQVTSTAPTVAPGGLEPRRLVLRSFGVATEAGYEFLPGGLGRVAARNDQFVISNMSGALAKDVWVLQPGPVGAAEQVSEIGRSRRRVPQVNLPTGLGLVPRIAENLFWMGRYAERAEGTARLIAVADDLVEDYGNRPGSPGHAAMTVLLAAVTQVTTSYPGFVGPGASERLESPLAELRQLIIDGEEPSTVAYAISRLVAGSQQVRDQLSLDTWIVLGRLERTIADIHPDDAQLQPQLARVLESLMAFAGIMAQGMVRDTSWGFIDAGARLERALQTAALLSSTIALERAPVADGQITEAVLQSGVSVITHRRRTTSGAGPAAPAESATNLLLLDRTNPRSIAYQVDRLVEDFVLIGDDSLVTRFIELNDRLRELDAESLCANGRQLLQGFLPWITEQLRGLADEITIAHFARKPQQRSLVPSWDMGRQGAR